jgi:hypothetical protein
VTHISVGFALVVSALFGIAGYATFRALSQGNKKASHTHGVFIKFSLELFNF